MVEGYLGQLVLQIPWSNLKNKPVKIDIEDVFVLAVPNLHQDHDPEDDARRALALKLNKLEKHELAGKITDVSPEEASQQQSFTENLVSKIVDNVQVTIKNIHVRYKDEATIPGHPFSIGLSLAELSAVSTNADWDPSFIQVSTPITYKLMTLSSLSMYWNTDESDNNDSDTLQFMATVTEKTMDDFQYILRPVSGTGHVTLNKLASDGPSAKAQLLFHELGFVFDSDQYRDALSVAEFYHTYLKTKDFQKFKPKVSVDKDPKAWFKYAGDVVLSQVNEKNKQWTWEYVLGRRIDRLRYIELYKKKTTNPPLSALDTDEYNMLEKTYSFDDLSFFRSLAKAELKKEKAQAPPPAPAAQSTWSSWIWGSTEQKTDEIAGEQITKEQQQEFYDAIEWDAKQAAIDSMEGKKQVVSLEVETLLKTGSFTLRRDPHEHSDDIMQVLFNGFKSKFYNRADSFLTTLSLHELRVDDNATSSLFKQVLTVKPISSDLLPEFSHTSCSDHDHDDGDAFFNLSYEHNPIDGNADSNLFVKMKSITMFYNVPFIENVVRFFQPPKSYSETIGALLDAASATVGEFRDLTRMSLEYALQEHKTLNLKMDIQAPLIIIPLDVTTRTSPCAIFDAGHISVESHLASKDAKEKVEEKRTAKYTEEDWKALESLMYDKYDVKLHSTQFFIGANLLDTMKELKNPHTPTSVIDKLNLDFLVEVSIIPDAPNITRFKVSGILPLFSASLSDEKYRILMQLINSSIPNFEQPISDTDTLNEINMLVPAHSIALPEYDESSETSTLQEVKPETLQKFLEFNFTVEKVELFLNRCVSVETLQQERLVDLQLEYFKADFQAWPDKMTSSLSLRDIVIDDHIQKRATGDLAKIVTSMSESTGDLLTLNYKRQKAEDSKDAFDQDIGLSLSTLKFVVAPKSLLTLLDFVTSTFASPAESKSPSPELEQAAVAAPAAVAEGKINVKIDLHSIIILLNDDGIKLATLQLDSAQVDMKLEGQAMLIQGQLGQLSLHDEINEGTPRNSILRQLVSFEGSNLADFKYQTFDPACKSPFNSSIFFRSGSMRCNIVEEPLTRIVKFMGKLSQMKALYDMARAAAFTQADKIEDANKIHFDIIVSTPIIVIPRLVESSTEGVCDTLVAHLGDIFARNEYTKLANDPNGPTVNRIIAGVRAIKLNSNIHSSDDGTQRTLEMIDNIDLCFDMSYAEPFAGMQRPETAVSGFLSESNIKLTELQCKFLLDASAALSRIIANDSAMPSDELDELGKELGLQDNLKSMGLMQTPTEVDPDMSHNKMEINFDAKKVSLSLYNHTSQVDAAGLEKCALSRFALTDSNINMHLKNNGDLEASISMKSFTVHDIRSVKENKFSEIIPATLGDQTQFSCKVSLSGSTNVLDAQCNLHKPTVIVALDYLLALKTFVDAALPASPQTEAHEEPVFEDVEDQPIDVKRQLEPHSNELKVHFNVTVSDASMILIANPKLTDSEAIVFKVESATLSQDDALTVSAGNVGMFLCRMNNFYDNRLRIIDDFSMTAVMDTTGSKPGMDVAKINVACDELVLRLSLRDVLLALDIIRKASEVSSSEPSKQPASIDNTPKYSRFTKARSKSITTGTTKRRRSSVARRPSISTCNCSQFMSANFAGLRFVLINAVHGLPVLDMFVKPFQVTAHNWSANLSINASIDTFVNVYNFQKSAWEPLIEPWGCSFDVSSKDNRLSIRLDSDKMAQMTLTTQTIGIVSDAVNYFSEGVDFLSRPGGDASLYRIMNQTGYDVEVWVDDPDRFDNKATVIGDNEEVPWSFEDWHTMRENLSTDPQKVDLGVKLKSSPFSPVRKISVSSVGEQLFPLKSESSRSGHQLMCEIVLINSIKYIILRSPLTYENNTQIPIEIGINIGGAHPRYWSVKPGESRSVPINHPFDMPVYVRPDPKIRFQWTEQPIYWQALLKGTTSVSCRPEGKDNAVRYYYRVSALYDNADSRSRSHPTMRIILSPPVEIRNLLPFDFTYRIFDKSAGKDWSNSLKKGEKSAVHVVEPSRLLLLSIHPQGCGFGQSEFAVINSPHGSDFARESRLTTRSNEGQRLSLKLHYM